MKPSSLSQNQDLLFQSRLSSQLNPLHPLFKLAEIIQWCYFEETFGTLFHSGPGQPPKPIRLVVGLLMLQHMSGLSDEKTVSLWVENPYWQFFCGYDHLQWAPPLDPSSLIRWRKRLGPEGLEKILSATVQTAVKTDVVKKKDLERVIVDTTVMEKNIRFPTDSELLNKAREQLVRLAKKHGFSLRQSYSRVGKMLVQKIGRYAHAKQMNRVKKGVKKLKTYLGRVVREIERILLEDHEKTSFFSELLEKAQKLLLQEKKSSDKLYSLHAPEVYCISKGKARHPYEFGCKVSLVVTHKQGLVLSCQALSKPFYDGHTLKPSLENAESVADCGIKQAFVDKGYKGHEIKDKEVYISGQWRGLTRTLRKRLKRRSAVEPHIGHMKSDGKLGRSFLKGHEGDQINAILCGIGHNMRLILNYLKYFFTSIQIFIFFSVFFKEKKLYALAA